MGDSSHPHGAPVTSPAAPAVEHLRVTLLDCYANSNLFVGDEAFRALVGPLRDMGIATQLLDLVRDEPRPGTDIDTVLAAVRAAAPTLIVVSRVWSAELLTGIRAAAGSETRIVRYSHGAPSSLDPQFDAVLNNTQVLDFIRGAERDRPDDEADSEGATKPRWRRTKSELASGGPLIVSTAARASIAGPAHGCPFLVDVRTSPAYRDSGIDYDRVQTKGCAFCLDNVGAFASFPPDVIVDTWLTQLRALRRQRPDMREVLLTDERPHPYLPALFRAIGAEPALHGLEILIKTRVDWLEEYADTALREACELAEQSGSVLHAYLVGFESFHQPDLDLFNKAVTVADNVRAIDTLQALESRHPRSFEFRRLHMHGIILFHPWTTPAGLLENARIMRAVRFHEVRQYALRTRMRLYNSVPLHALAERDGLLVDHFEAGRDDRAVEQGYDASVPWRFNDVRVEAIFRAANRVAEAMPSLHDADVLEMVTRFVLRWPAFADQPDLAALPLLQAPFSWGTFPADIVAVAGAPVAGFDREVEAVAAGAKAACLKEGVPHADAESLVRAYETMGLAATEVSTHERGSDDGRHGPGSTHAIVAVARDRATLDRVVAQQQAVERSDEGAIFAMGDLMGYPRCCVEAFASQRGRGDNLDLERAPLRSHPDQPLAPLLNRFGAVSLLSHMLCSPTCTASLALARTRLATLTDVDSAAPMRISTHLATSMLRLDYRQAAMVSGAWAGDRYVVRSMQPLVSADFGIDLASVRSIQISGNRVALGLASGHEHVVVATAPVLVEPNQPVAPAVRRALHEARNLPHPSPDTQQNPRAAGIATIAALLAPNASVGDYIVASTELDTAAGLRVILAHDAQRLQVLIRRWDPARPALSRRGPWSLDLADDHSPSEGERRAIGALAMLLPAGSHQQGS